MFGQGKDLGNGKIKDEKGKAGSSREERGSTGVCTDLDILYSELGNEEMVRIRDVGSEISDEKYLLNK